MSDVRLFHTADGGEIDLVPDGTYTEVILDTGLETAVYLSLFGGNEQDPGTVHDDADPEHGHQAQWWGNLGEPLVRMMRSEFGHLVNSLPVLSSNLVRLEQAAVRDLEWFTREGVASELSVTATQIGKDRVRADIRILVDKEEYTFAFFAIWGN